MDWSCLNNLLNFLLRIEVSKILKAKFYFFRPIENLKNFHKFFIYLLFIMYYLLCFLFVRFFPLGFRICLSLKFFQIPHSQLLFLCFVLFFYRILFYEVILKFYLDRILFLFLILDLVSFFIKLFTHKLFHSFVNFIH